jgi:hypothetical protein
MGTENKETSLSSYGGNVVPALRRVEAQPDGVVPIVDSDTVVMTLPALHAAGNPVVITACLQFTPTDDATLTYKLFRSDDGGGAFAEIDAGNQYARTFTSGDPSFPESLTWYDIPLSTTEAAMAPIYQLVILSSVAVAGEVETASHFIAHT